MSLQFVLGRAGSGKSEYCIKQASLAESQGKRVIMIVPEQYSHQGESAFLKEKGYIHDDFNVTSFGRLAKKLIASSGTFYNAADSAGKAMLVLKAIMNCRTKLAFYSAAAEKPGYISLFMDAISEFKKGRFPPRHCVLLQTLQRNIFLPHDSMTLPLFMKNTISFLLKTFPTATMI